MKEIKITPSKKVIDKLIESQLRMIRDSKNFLSKFTEDEDGHMTDEVYIRCQKLGVDEQTINFLYNLLQSKQYELNQLFDK